MNARPLAVVTGASSGIGYELAVQCARHGFDLVIAADQSLRQATDNLAQQGVKVSAVETDLATPDGVAQLYASLGGFSVDVLIANAGHGLGGAFLDQDLTAITHVVDTNITGTLALIHQVGREMSKRRAGRILIVGSIAGFMPGAFQAVYNGTKAFIDSFSWALRNELQDTGVSVTCLMPGATETEFFKRAGMMDTRIGVEEKMDAAEVARIGFKAMMDGEGDAVAGWKNKVQAAVASVTPAAALAELHRKKGAARHWHAQAIERSRQQHIMVELQIPTGAMILVGDGRKALFLRNKGAPTHVELTVERVLEHADAPTREQGTDRPGRYRGSDGVSRSAFEQTDWHQLEEDRFAAEIGGALNRLAHENRFYHLILVAPAKVLGTVRTQLDKDTTSRIVAQVPKDLTSHPIAEIARTLST